MGFVDAFKEAVTPKFVKDVNTALTTGQTPSSSPQGAYEAQTRAMNQPDAAQQAYDAKVKAMNANNPHFTNVDNSGLTTEKAPWPGYPK